MRVFLDTNVLVAAFATRGLCEDVLKTVLSRHAWVSGEPVMSELERILTAKLKMPRSQARAVVTFVRDQADVTDPSEPSTWPAADPDDRWIVAAALQGGADVLVTGDRALLEDRSNAPLPVLSPRDFWESLR